MLLYVQYIKIHAHYIRGPKKQILCVAMSLQNVTFRHFGHVMVGLNADVEQLDPGNEEELKKIYLAKPPFKILSTSDVDLPSPNYFVNEILHFEECCRTGAEPLSSGRDNIETMKIIMGIYESSRIGKAVNLDDL